jgi:hypothetical protein
MRNKASYPAGLLCGALMLAFTMASPRPGAAQTGVFLAKTVTFSRTGTAAMTFVINGPKAHGLTTTVWLEFGSDDAATALPGPFGGVTFQLQKSGIASPLSLTNGLDNNEVYATGERIQFNDQSGTAGAPRLLKLDITHLNPATGIAIPAGSSETWTLSIAGFPAGSSPPARLIAYLADPTGQFSSLTPLGPSSTGSAAFPVSVAVTTPTTGTVRFEATVPAGTPSGLTYEWTAEGDANAARGTPSGNILTYTLEACGGCCCRNITYRVDVKQGTTVLSSNRGVYSQRDLGGCGGGTVCPVCPPWRVVFEIPWWEKVPVWPWPWPGPGPDPCLSCPPEWKTRVPEDYFRKIIALRPTDETGSLLGPGLKDAIKVDLKDARVIGPLMETGSGEYFAAVEYKKGADPRVTASVNVKGRSLSTGEISLEPRATPGWIAWVLFAVSALANIYLAGRQYMQRTQRQ